MKSIITAALIALFPVIAWSQADGCTTSTYDINGKYIVCVTCCANGFCNTTCD